MLLFLERISEFVNVVQPKKITQRHVKKRTVGKYIHFKERAGNLLVHTRGARPLLDSTSTVGGTH